MSAQSSSVRSPAVAVSDTRLRQLLNSTPSIIYSTQVHGDYACTFVNDNVHAVLGYSPEEMLNDSKFWLSNLHPDDVDRVTEEFVAQLELGAGTLEYRFRCKDGRYIWIHDTHRVIHDDQGRPLEIIGSWTDITVRQELSEELSYQATHDSLTGLVNRAEFEKRLERFLESAGRRGWVGALCYMDLDQFKVINDSLGHVAGDRLLRELGALLQTQVRERDTLARLGGDEFGLLLEHCETADAERVAENVRKIVDGYRFVWEDQAHQVGVSIGITRLDKNIGVLSDALKQADSACYIAKEFGRNRIYVYRDDDADVEQRRTEIALVAEINRALEEDRFMLDCQQIVPMDPNSGHGAHYEILVRMIDGRGDRVPPGLFLPAAERYGLAIRIDRWVVERTLQWLAANPRHTGTLAACSINLSGHSVGDSHTAEFLRSAISGSGVAPEKICFEITETAAVTNLAAAIDLIHSLRELGCRFALDDFGSGFSSFAYLGRLPVDYLKIDGAFVKDICDNPVHEVFVSAINDIGHVMDLETIAEFVENDAIMNSLRRLGVDYAQGFGIGRPRPLDELLDRR